MSKKYYVALLGFGSANQELAKLLHDKRDYLTKTDPNFGEIVVSGIFTRYHGGAWTTSADGLDLRLALDLFDQKKSSLNHDLGKIIAGSLEGRHISVCMENGWNPAFQFDSLLHPWLSGNKV